MTTTKDCLNYVRNYFPLTVPWSSIFWNYCLVFHPCVVADCFVQKAPIDPLFVTSSDTYWGMVQLCKIPVLCFGQLVETWISLLSDYRLYCHFIVLSSYCSEHIFLMQNLTLKMVLTFHLSLRAFTLRFLLHCTTKYFPILFFATVPLSH